MILKAYAAFVDGTPILATIASSEHVCQDKWRETHSFSVMGYNTDIRPVWITTEEPIDRKESDEK